ncbi:hypothetical protein KO489_03995 [Reinekea forsetii]|nr:hypothetical protein [Reinekea forsetii]
MLIILLCLTLLWAVYCSFRRYKPEYITIVSLSFLFIYYIIGGWLFSDVYFPMLKEKVYVYAVIFPVIVSALFLASIVGNIAILSIPFKPRIQRIKSIRRQSLLGFYGLAIFYSILIIGFILESGFGIFGSSGGIQENVSARTALVYENRLYTYVSYAVFFIIPLVSIIFIEFGRKWIAFFLLILSAGAIAITGQKSSLALVLLTVFFYFLIKFGFLRALKLIAIPFFVVVVALVTIVMIWNQDSLTGSFGTNLYLSSKGILERVTLTGTKLASEYIYLTDTIEIGIENKPTGKPISMFVYDLIEADGLVGSKPAHIFFVKYFTDGIAFAFLATFFLYLFYFIVKIIADIDLVDQRYVVAINAWILVSIVNSTITDSFMHISAWLFSVLYLFGASISIVGVARVLSRNRTIKVPFSSLSLNVLCVGAFFFYIQGFVRGLQ